MLFELPVRTAGAGAAKRYSGFGSYVIGNNLVVGKATAGSAETAGRAETAAIGVANGSVVRNSALNGADLSTGEAMAWEIFRFPF